MEKLLSPESLRNAFWQEDKKQGELIHKQYKEIKAVLAKQDIAWVEVQYKKLKEHAI